MKSDPDFRLVSQLANSLHSEWEDNVLFDADDPDFGAPGTAVTAGQSLISSVLFKGMIKSSSNMLTDLSCTRITCTHIVA